MQVKSEKWSGLFIDLLPGSQVDSGTILQVLIEQPAEPMVHEKCSVCVCVCGVCVVCLCVWCVCCMFVCI